MYTIKDILKLKPCKEYTEDRLKELWEDKKTLSRREILKLDIDIGDKNWVVPQLVSTEVVVTWAQYCADEAEKHANVAASARCAASAARYTANAARYTANAARSAAHAARYAAADATARPAAYYANEAARSAGYAASAARYAAADAGSTWSENRGKELYRLLTVLCDMEEECTQ